MSFVYKSNCPVKNLFISVGLFISLWLASLSVHAQPQVVMPLQSNQSAPSFQAQDVRGNAVSLKTFQGHFLLLAFMRNAGCPVCNFHIHQLLTKADSLQKANIAVVLVYESTNENLLHYLNQDEPMPFTFIADPQQQLYSLYGVKGDMGKLMKGLFYGAMGKMRQGKRLFRSAMKQDGHVSTVGADFLIDPKGQILDAHYSQFFGDHLTTAQIIHQVQLVSARN